MYTTLITILLALIIGIPGSCSGGGDNIAHINWADLLGANAPERQDPNLGLIDLAQLNIHSSFARESIYEPTSLVERLAEAWQLFFELHNPEPAEEAALFTGDEEKAATYTLYRTGERSVADILFDIFKKIFGSENCLQSNEEVNQLFLELELTDDKRHLNFITSDTARSLITFGFQIYRTAKIGQRSVLIALTHAEELAEHRDAQLCIALAANKKYFDRAFSQANSYVRLDDLREIFIRMAQIATCLSENNHEIVQKLTKNFKPGSSEDPLIITGRKGLISRFEEDGGYWKIFPCSTLYPNLVNAFALYELLLQEQPVLTNSLKLAEVVGSEAAKTAASDQYLLYHFMMDMIRSYADAFLAINECNPNEPAPWDRDKLPELIERWHLRFMKVARVREKLFKRFYLRSADRVRRPKNQEQDAINEKEKEQKAEKEKEKEEDHAESSGELLPGRIRTTLETRLSWQERVDQQRSEGAESKRQKRQRMVEEHQEEQKIKAQKEAERRRSNEAVFILQALWPCEQKLFHQFLEKRRITSDPAYQALLNPSKGTTKITNDALDNLFTRLCKALGDFLVQEQIGDQETNVRFVEGALEDLLGTRHNFHDTREGEDLPDNFITHRRAALIYTGMIAADSMKQGDKDKRIALEKYSYRLLSRSAQ